MRNHVRLHGPWAGWRLAGRDLVSPEGIGMVTVIRMPVRDWHAERFGSRAG